MLALEVVDKVLRETDLTELAEEFGRSWVGVTFRFTVLRVRTLARSECILAVSLSASNLFNVDFEPVLAVRPFGEGWGAGLTRSSTETSISKQ